MTTNLMTIAIHLMNGETYKFPLEVVDLSLIEDNKDKIDYITLNGMRIDELLGRIKTSKIDLHI